MLLQRLKEYADSRIEQTPRLYKSDAIRYTILLDAEGKPASRSAVIDSADPANRAFRRGRQQLVPRLTRTVGVQPLLLADHSEYTFGLARENSKPERAERCHQAYLDLLARCVEQTQEPAVRAVQAFLTSQPLDQLDLPDDFDRGAYVVFAVSQDGASVYPTALLSVHDFWAAEHDPAAHGSRTLQCLICGQQRPVLSSLPAPIKRVPGGQPSGTAMISANANAFESYGLERSLIAPTCGDCAERFTMAANELLADEQSCVRFPSAAFIYWTRQAEPSFSLRGLMVDPQPGDVRALLRSARSGQRAADVDQSAFYGTMLSASGGRTVVRDWIDTTIGEVEENLARWFRGQDIVDAQGETGRPLGVYALAAATVRDANRDLGPLVPGLLLRAALAGKPLPEGLLFQAVRRNRAEQTVTRQRAALMKLVISSGTSSAEDDRMVQLDSENQSAAYRCGRLLAVLEEVQRRAIGKASIVDRFYGSASSAPASVFGRLLRGAQPHLAKLERDRRGAYIALQQQLEEIQSGLGGFPATLKLRDQGVFGLGYYHQRAHQRAEARAGAERRRATGQAPPEGDLDQTDGAESPEEN